MGIAQGVVETVAEAERERVTVEVVSCLSCKLPRVLANRLYTPGFTRSALHAV